jgi:methylphosphotriester-DNA--protein-cysteine methyltransferase
MRYQSPADIAQFILSRNNQELSHLTPESITEMFNGESSSIHDDFEAKIQISLDDYLSRERIYRAAHQLRKHQVSSLESLGDSLGFEDSQTFSSEFKRFFHIEPERYFYLMEVKRFKQQFLRRK